MYTRVVYANVCKRMQLLFILRLYSRLKSDLMVFIYFYLFATIQNA
ncbi:hypothetical protein HMPREF3216_00588 [Gardnerella vaginalis]|uniref:Uncharacterized protein n=1 Tax=Gardnerella vaginalis TaxID=2702 RepID=A0A133NPS0_GARVA|nr:hypothetical protein HMPREF3216_00588 [Gardnerella vaginalis]